MLRHHPGLGLLLSGMLMLVGCATPSPSPLPAVPSDAEASHGTIWFMPTLASPLDAQAIVHPYQVTDIHRIELVPYLIDETYQAHPLSRLSGEPTTADDPELLKAEMSGDALNLTRAIALSGLRQGQEYRVVAHAYARSGELISLPEASALRIQVESDDRPLIPYRVPLRLKPVLFLGTLPLEIALSDPDSRLDHLVVTVYRVWDGVPYPQGSSSVLRRQDLPGLVTLLNLSAHASYQVELRARPRESASPDLAVETVTVNMENDDAPATRSVTVKVP